MSNQSNSSQSIYNLGKIITSGNLLPIFFLFGEDGFTITNAVKELTKVADKQIASEFDKQIIDATKDTNVSTIADEASAFPFGGQKKLVVVKNFENINDKKQLVEYVKNPADFTILIITQSGKKLDLRKEPFKTLAEYNYLFEAHELRGMELINWITRECKKLGLVISQDNARSLVELIGENKALVEMNLLKFSNYLEKGEEITPDTIEKLTSITKEYNIFNLQDAIGVGNKSKSIEIAYNLISNDSEAIKRIPFMLNKFISTIACSLELSQNSLSEFNAAKEANVSPYYYKNCLKANYFKNYERLHNASEALLWADQTLKTTSMDSKTLVTILITRMLK